MLEPSDPAGAQRSARRSPTHAGRPPAAMPRTLSEPIFQQVPRGQVIWAERGKPSYAIVRGVNFVYDRVRAHRRQVFAVGALAGVFCGGAFLITLLRLSPASSEFICGPREETYRDILHYSDVTKNLVGINLGGWLCLEDWLFSGSVGRFVATPKLNASLYDMGQGACLPPLVPGPLERPWASEGQLTTRLASGEMGTINGSGRAFAAAAFRKHRESFMLKTDFRQIRTLGIKSVRVPVSWALFADVLAEWDAETYGSHNPNVDTHIIPDPYYTDYMLATIPRKWLKNMLTQMADEGLRIILDIHSTPGGSSDSTNSPVWPEIPAFWTKSTRVGKHPVPLTKVGLSLSKAVIDWVEDDLSGLLSHGAIWGICLLNEPAHLSFGKSEWLRDEWDIIRYIENYTEIFRASLLPSNGVRLYVQITESAFSDWDSVVPGWYSQFFSHEERHTWAVMARHYHSAWNDTCNGAILPTYSDAAGSFRAGYQCDQALADVEAKVKACAGYYSQYFVKQIDGLRAITAWSIGTHWDANIACSNENLLRIIFNASLNEFADLGSRSKGKVEPVFWTWSTPYGPKFQPGWSLKYFSGLTVEGDRSSDGRCVVGPWAREIMQGYADSRETPRLPGGRTAVGASAS